MRTRFFRGARAGVMAGGVALGLLINGTQAAGSLLVNGGFEEGLRGWTIGPKDGGISSVSTAKAASGTHSLYVHDASPKGGSEVVSARIPVGKGAYELRGKSFLLSGSGLGVYVRDLTSSGQPVKRAKPLLASVNDTPKKWLPFSFTFEPAPESAFVEIWIHSYAASAIEVYLDDLEFVPVAAPSTTPLWAPQYKIKPQEKSRLTAADVVGPDGMVYPDWHLAGVQGGIPNVPAVAKLEDFGGAPGREIAEALEKAVAAAAQKGGGAVVIGAGTFYLDRPVTIRESNIVLRGQGEKQTRIIFRYAMPKEGAVFYWPKANARVGAGTPIELQCKPQGLMKMRIVADDNRVLAEWARSKHSGNTFAFRTAASALAKLSDGPHKLKGIGEYDKGSPCVTQIGFTLDRSVKNPVPPNSQYAICFEGRGLVGAPLKLAKDGKRGDTTVELASAQGLAAGDYIQIEGPATERWKQLTRNRCDHGSYRFSQLRVEEVKGNSIRVNQPLRIEYPTIDGSYVQKISVLEHCGIENLYIEQTEDLWITAASFEWAWNCWAKGVRIRKCGRNPVYAHNAKWCEIRDCVFDDAWYKGGGGTAYTGWEKAWDCLMENVETFKFRHAPLVQWAAAGCVVRKGVFHDSDAQWHSGWTHENLFEQCVITSVTGNGGYGYGMWASPPEDTAHGPNGPRNVIYNCDVSSPKDGLWMGGMNENWIVAYNRFVVEKGAGVTMKTFSFDHLIRGNVFVLKDATAPMVLLQTPDCTGVEMQDNTLAGGNGQFAAGRATPLRSENNQRAGASQPARPTPAVPSIYEWQVKNAKAGGK